MLEYFSQTHSAPRSASSSGIAGFQSCLSSTLLCSSSGGPQRVATYDVHVMRCVIRCRPTSPPLPACRCCCRRPLPSFFSALPPLQPSISAGQAAEPGWLRDSPPRWLASSRQWAAHLCRRRRRCWMQRNAEEHNLRAAASGNAEWQRWGREAVQMMVAYLQQEWAGCL